MDSEGKRSFYWTNRVVSVVGAPVGGHRGPIVTGKARFPDFHGIPPSRPPRARIYARLIAGINAVFSR